MAHIKVVRRSMRPEEWTDLRFGWLKRHIYSSKWEIKILWCVTRARFPKWNMNIIRRIITR